MTTDTTIVLRDGTELAVRPVRPDDRSALAAAFASMSDESLYRRFMSPKRILSARELTYFTEVDHRTHEALIAVDATGAVVGETRYASGLDDPRSADIAFAVVDSWHGRGVGGALARRLIGVAREAGIERLTASMLAMNLPARGLIRALGFTPLGTRDGASEFELVLAPAPALAAAA